MSTENSDKMKAISYGRLRVAIRTVLRLEMPGGVHFEHLLDELSTQIMRVAVEIQRPDTVLKSEYDLVVAKNATLVQLMALMTDRLNEKSDSDVATKT